MRSSLSMSSFVPTSQHGALVVTALNASAWADRNRDPHRRMSTTMHPRHVAPIATSYDATPCG